MLEGARLELVSQRRELLGAQADTGELAFGDRASGAAVVAHVLLAEPGAHRAAVARGSEEPRRGREPVAARSLMLRGDDLDDLPVGERAGERHHAAVDLGAAAAVTERGVDVVGEVERSRAAR